MNKAVTARVPSHKFSQFSQFYLTTYQLAVVFVHTSQSHWKRKTTFRTRDGIVNKFSFFSAYHWVELLNRIISPFELLASHSPPTVIQSNKVSRATGWGAAQKSNNNNNKNVNDNNNDNDNDSNNKSPPAVQWHRATRWAAQQCEEQRRRATWFVDCFCFLICVGGLKWTC